MVSHVKDEVSTNGKNPTFIPPPIKRDTCNETKFDEFLVDFIPQPRLAYLRQNISNRYSSSNYKEWRKAGKCPKGNQMERVANVIRDAVFTCNTRLLYDAYQSKAGVPTYMMQYSLFQLEKKAVHASDLLPTFWNSEVDCAKSLPACFGVSDRDAKMIAGTLNTLAPPYQSYFASHAMTGDPNLNATGLAKSAKWKVASVVGGSLTNVLEARGLDSFFHNITDGTNTASSCDCWKNIAIPIQTTRTTQRIWD